MGYGRLVHPVTGATEGFKMALAQTGLCDFHEDSTNVWVKLKNSVRQQELFVYSGSITAANMHDANVFSVLDSYWWDFEKICPQVLPYNSDFYKKTIEEARGYKKLLWIKSLLFRVGFSDYVQLLREIAVPAFLTAYPKGRIHIIRIDKGLLDLLQTIDLIGILGVYSIHEIKQGRRQSITAGQGRGLGSLGSNILQAVLSGFHPNVYGIVAERFSFLLVFQCHPVLKIYKRTTIPSLSDVLRAKRILEPNLALQNITNEQDLKTKLEDTRLLHVTRWRGEDIDKLVEWTVKRINALYLSLINPSLFLKDDKSIDFIKQRQFYITIDRIVSEAFLKLGFRSLMRLKASDTGGIWPYEKRLTPRYFIPPQSGPMGVLKRLLRNDHGQHGAGYLCTKTTLL